MIDVLIVGSGEYVTGFTGDKASQSDKTFGVIALSLFDLRQRGKVGRILMAGRDGSRFPGIRRHFAQGIAKTYSGLNTQVETWPADDQLDPNAYRQALKSLKTGSAVIVVTPDDTHHQITKQAIEQGMHVLVAKPLVQTLAQHQSLLQAAEHHQALVMVEVHKRFDPIYADARDQARDLGDFSYMHSYMSQPKKQLETFKSWAGKSSDISYYLNAHHIDLHVWMMQGRAKPVSVTALASTGVAEQVLNVATEDTITLSVQWKNTQTGNLGTGIYTASWIAPESDVHSQQRFFYMGHKGEINVDQAHRGYQLAKDGLGFKSVNPLFMKYEPSDGRFAGQQAYGYRSIEIFIDAAVSVACGHCKPEFYDSMLPTVASTLATTAILEAGRLSLDQGGRRIELD